MYAGEETLGSMHGNLVAEAFAFRLLVRHFRKVSDEAANIDIMGASGVCRNCLAKFYTAGTHYSGSPVSYGEACEYIYGEPYETWKQKQKKATPEQLDKFNATKRWHAKHEKDLEAWAAPSAPSAEACCYDDDDVPAAPAASTALRLGVLTVSDRASSGEYRDASGPAVVEQARSTAVVADLVTRVVADDADAIAATIVEWSATCNLVLTTGGTGFGPRDVTPEATTRVIDKPAPGIIDLVHAKAWRDGGDAETMLSRATAGVRATCLVVNLPGRPDAAKRNLAVLMPTLVKAVGIIDPNPVA